MKESISKEHSQPEVELVNTRASHGNTHEKLDDLFETEADITPDSRVDDSSCNGNDIGLSPEGVLRCIAWCKKLQQSKLFQRDTAPQTSAAVSRSLTKSTSKTTVRVIKLPFGIFFKALTLAVFLPPPPIEPDWNSFAGLCDKRIGSWRTCPLLWRAQPR